VDLLAHLAAFVAVVDEANFSRAADRLAIAQPLLSRRVKTLEDHFGGLLFDRSRRQITTTEFGLLLLPYARDVLDRAQRLRHVASSARGCAARAVGVPADCDPAVLARVIRAGAEHDSTLSMRELPPEERAAALADGSLAYALLRVLPDGAALRVPLGLASRPEADVPRAVHLDDLRPRRGRGPASPPILVMVEDDFASATDRMARAAARAGLPESRFGAAGSFAAALAETLSGRAMLLCTAAFARRNGAAWAPLADESLHRGYDVAAAPSTRAGAPGWLVALLAAAVGAARAGIREDASTRLAARG
jgi:DNA-binding transcriptional LysR family regulator